MFITKKHLPRRTFLRGVGVTLALPFLDSMVPAQTPLIQTAANPKSRLGFIYVPHGAVMKEWTPVTEGASFELTPILSPLAPVRNQVLILSNLAATAAEAGVDVGGDHARSAVAYLSGVHPKKTGGDDIHAGITIDQIAAGRIGHETPLPSLELTMEDTKLVGTCDDGFSCAYQNSIAWSSPTTPLPMEINPRVIFERMFGDGSTAAQRLAQREKDRSILDSITQEVAHLKVGLGPRERARFSDYLDDIREVERRIELGEKRSAVAGLEVPETPSGVPQKWEDHIHLMFDLQALAYQAEITRICTFMVAHDLSNQTYPQIGVPDQWHGTSHHQEDPKKLAKLALINKYHVQLFAEYLQKLRSIPDGDGTLLDHSLILYGSTMSNSNNHDHSPLPMLLAGGASGKMKAGYHVRTKERTHLSNLLLTILDRVGIDEPQIGDSTGKLEV